MAFIYIIRKSWWYIIAFTVVALLSSYLYIRWTPKVYESSSIIQIRNENKARDVLGIQGPQKNDELAKEIEFCY